MRMLDMTVITRIVRTHSDCEDVSAQLVEEWVKMTDVW